MPEAIRDLFLEERRQEILDRINQAGRASVADLSQQFGVSEVTIRADLQALSERNLVVRTHGGAISSIRGPYELSLATRRQQQVVEKGRIGAAAAAMVADGDAIFLDSSSTVLAIAQNLKNCRDLHRHHQWSDNRPGAHRRARRAGRPDRRMLRRETVSLVGGNDLEGLRRFNIRKGFFGAHGISAAEGLTDVSLAEAEVKRPVVAMCPASDRRARRHQVGPRRSGVVCQSGSDEQSHHRRSARPPTWWPDCALLGVEVVLVHAKLEVGCWIRASGLQPPVQPPISNSSKEYSVPWHPENR